MKEDSKIDLKSIINIINTQLKFPLKDMLNSADLYCCVCAEKNYAIERNKT